MTIELLDTEEAWQTEDPVEVQGEDWGLALGAPRTLWGQGQPQAAPVVWLPHPRSLCAHGPGTNLHQGASLLAEHWPRSPKRRRGLRCSLRDQGCVPGQEGHVGASLASTQTLAPSLPAGARPFHGTRVGVSGHQPPWQAAAAHLAPEA